MSPGLTLEVKTAVLKAALDVGYKSALTSALKIANAVATDLGKKELWQSVYNFLHYTLSQIQMGRRCRSLTGIGAYEELVKSADASATFPTRPAGPPLVSTTAVVKPAKKAGKPKKTAAVSRISAGTVVKRGRGTITGQKAINSVQNSPDSLQKSSTPIATGFSADVIKTLEQKMEKFVKEQFQQFMPIVTGMIENALKARFPEEAEAEAAAPAVEEMDQEEEAQPGEINNEQETAAPPPTEVPSVTSAERMEELFRGVYQNLGLICAMQQQQQQQLREVREGIMATAGGGNDVVPRAEEPQQQAASEQHQDHQTEMKTEPSDADLSENSGEPATSVAGLLHGK